jgi:hypothetical protein
MSAPGITLMALGALGTAALIGLDVQGSSATVTALGGGIGTLALFFVGSVVLLRGRSHRAEVARVNDLADDVQHEARVHLLEGREAELLRQVVALETRRDEILAETAAAAAAGTRHPSTRVRPKPALVMVPNPD